MTVCMCCKHTENINDIVLVLQTSLYMMSGLIIVWGGVHFKPCQSAHANMLFSPNDLHALEAQPSSYSSGMTNHTPSHVVSYNKSSHHPQSNSIMHQVTWWVMIESWTSSHDPSHQSQL